MVIIGIDAHKYTHTVVAVDGQGRQLATKTIGTTTADHLALLGVLPRQVVNAADWR